MPPMGRTLHSTPGRTRFARIDQPKQRKLLCTGYDGCSVFFELRRPMIRSQEKDQRAGHAPIPATHRLYVDAPHV